MFKIVERRNVRNRPKMLHRSCFTLVRVATDLEPALGTLCASQESAGPHTGVVLEVGRNPEETHAEMGQNM